MTQWLNMTRRGILLGMMLCVVMFMPGMVPDASAEITAMQFGQNFSCGGGGGGGGQFYTAGSCAGSPADGQVFSYFVCKFEEIINEALSQVYCAIVAEAQRPVTVGLTLAVLFLGMAFLMGVSPFTAKELMAFAAKFSLVMAFALEAEYMIGIGYALFMNFAKEGIIIVLNYLFETSYSSAGDVYRMFDDALRQMMQSVSADSREQGGQCQNALFSLMVLAAAALPPLAMMGMYFMVKIVWVMVRAVFGYCQGILGVTFLVTLAPIYVSFALFKPTRALFEKWIEHLISFSFQMVVVFAFLGMAFNIMSRMADDVSDYTSLVRPFNRDYREAGAANIFNMCGVCEMNRVAPGEPPSCASDRVMEIGMLSKDENFLHFATVKIFAMIIMFYLLDIMLDFVPQMARHLAGPKYAAQLGGGDTGGQDEVDVSIPGEKSMGNVLKAGAAGFKGYTTPGAMIGGFVSGGRQAMREGIDNLLVGAGLLGIGAVAGGRMLGYGDGGEPDKRETGSSEKTIPRQGATGRVTASNTGGTSTAVSQKTKEITQAVAALRSKPVVSPEGVSSASMGSGAVENNVYNAVMAMRASITSKAVRDAVIQDLAQDPELEYEEMEAAVRALNSMDFADEMGITPPDTYDT